MFNFKRNSIKITLLVLSLIYLSTLLTSLSGYGYPGSNGHYNTRSSFYWNNIDYYPVENTKGYRREGGGPDEGK